MPEDLRIKAIAVYPFGFRWGEPPYRSFELSHRLLDVASKQVGNQVYLFGPCDFRTLRADDDNVLAASTVGEHLPTYEVRPGELVVLRPWAERRVNASSKTLLDAKGRAVGAQRTEEVTYVGHLEVVHTTSRKVLFELRAEQVSDPFAERNDEGADPAPELTAMMEALTQKALEALSANLAPPAPAATLDGLYTSVTPGLGLAWSEPGRPAFEAEFVRMDALDREMFLRARARFANPSLPAVAVGPLVKAPPGLYVWQAPEALPLRSGDVVVSVNGAPACRHALPRARLHPGPDLLEVRRATGDFEKITLP